MKIYCAHPISGLKWKEVTDYYEKLKLFLHPLEYDVYHPMVGKEGLRKEYFDGFKGSGYKFPLATDHAIYTRDQWMVRQCDIFYLNLTGSKSISIGCVMELAWASLLGKHTILVSDNNIYSHCFITEAANVIFKSEDEALDYLRKLAYGQI